MSINIMSVIKMSADKIYVEKINVHNMIDVEKM